MKSKSGPLDSSALQTTVYDSLRAVLEQTSPVVFESYLSEFVKRLKTNAGTKDFSTYFESNWLPNKKEWGYAYRVGTGINTNMFCEAFHKNFKHYYLKGVVRIFKKKCL